MGGACSHRATTLGPKAVIGHAAELAPISIDVTASEAAPSTDAAPEACTDELEHSAPRRRRRRRPKNNKSDAAADCPADCTERRDPHCSDVADLGEQALQPGKDGHAGALGSQDEDGSKLHDSQATADEDESTAAEDMADDEDSLERTTTTVAVRCNSNRDGREHLVEYLGTVLTKLLETSASHCAALEDSVITSVRTSIVALAANTPIVTRQRITEELQAAETAVSAGKPLLQVFQEMLQSCLQVARADALEDQHKAEMLLEGGRRCQGPQLPAVGTRSKNAVVIRNTFLDVRAPSEWDDADGMGFRSTSDPTSRMSAVAEPKVIPYGELPATPCFAKAAAISPSSNASIIPATPEATPVNRYAAYMAPAPVTAAVASFLPGAPAAVKQAPEGADLHPGDATEETSTDEPSNIDVSVDDEDVHNEEAELQLSLDTGITSAQTTVKSVGQQGMSHQAPAFFPSDAASSLIIRNTFVDGVSSYEDSDTSSFGIRSSSDPTSGSGLWARSMSNRMFSQNAIIACPPVAEEDGPEAVAAEATAQQVLRALPLEEQTEPAEQAEGGKALALADLVEGPGFDPRMVDMSAYYPQGWWVPGTTAAACGYYGGAYYPQAFNGDYGSKAHDEHTEDVAHCNWTGTTDVSSASGVAVAEGDCTGPAFGSLHTFHSEFSTMGVLTPDSRQFTKEAYEGRLSVISESQVHTGGVHRYLVQFTDGELSKADGVGFIFSPRLPCKKNIQRIVSIFVNQHGQICMRMFETLIRADVCVEPLKLRDWVEMVMDLDKHTVTFCIWSSVGAGGAPASEPTSTAEFSFGDTLKDYYDKAQSSSRRLDFRKGHLACVVKNAGVTVTLGS